MDDLNRTSFELFRTLAGRGAFVDGLIVFAAEYMPYLLLFGFAVFLVQLKGEWRVRLAALGETMLTLIISRGVLTEAIRFVFPLGRPFTTLGITPLFVESTSAFPSGHAAFFFALAAAMWWQNRAWGWWFFALALVNGAARVAAGVHWPLDIAGGAFVGIGGALLAHGLVGKYIKELKEKASPRLPA